MPTIFTRTLTMTPAPNNRVRVSVTYLIFFSNLDRFLSAHGLRYDAHISIWGVDDPPVGLDGDDFLFTMNERIPSEAVVSAPNNQLTRTVERVVSRGELREDSVSWRAQIRAQIRVFPVGMPADVEALTETVEINLAQLEIPS